MQKHILLEKKNIAVDYYAKIYTFNNMPPKMEIYYQHLL